MAVPQEFRSMGASSIVEHDVEGVVLGFSPCTVDVLFRFQPAIAKAWKAIDNLNKDASKHSGYKDERVTGKDGETVETVTRPAIETSLFQLLSKERNAAIDNLVEAVMSEETRKAACELVANSLRNHDSKALIRLGLDPAKPEMLLQQALPVVKAMLAGMWKANKVAFGPLAGKVVDATTSRVASVLNRAQALQTPSPTSPSASPASSETSSSMQSGSADTFPTES